jgi:ATP-dependent Lhr-like helicase
MFAEAPPSGMQFSGGSRSEDARDPVEEIEIGKERARLLLDRYGVVYRDLLERELPVFGWKSIFESLRLLELSGEALSGHFFADLPGPQFLDPGAVEALESLRSRGEAEQGHGQPQHGTPPHAAAANDGAPGQASGEIPIYWLSARDPASPCGLGTHDDLPPRQGSSILVFHGPELCMVSRRWGKSVEVRLERDDPRLSEVVAVLRLPVERDFDPQTRVVIEEINGEHAASSRYAEALHELGFREERHSLVLWARYR